MVSVCGHDSVFLQPCCKGKTTAWSNGGSGQGANWSSQYGPSHAPSLLSLSLALSLSLSIVAPPPALARPKPYQGVRVRDPVKELLRRKRSLEVPSTKTASPAVVRTGRDTQTHKDKSRRSTDPHPDPIM